MASIRDAILGAEDLPRERVQTDEWAPYGAPIVYVRGLTAAERDAWELSLTIAGPEGGRIQKPGLKNIRAGFVARVLVEEDGTRVYEDKQLAKGIEELGNTSALVIERLWTVGRRLSGLPNAGDEEGANPSTGDLEDTSSPESPSPSE